DRALTDAWHDHAMHRGAAIGLLLASACAPTSTPIDASSAADAAMPHDAATAIDAGADVGIAPSDAGVVSYATTSAGTESPISDGGHGAHHAGQWAEVDTNGDVAYGTQPGDGAYTDSYALLAGLDFGPNQTATAVVHLADGFAPGGTREVEILLR